MKYIAARKNLALTIFVPWNCTNNCPFCTSKCDYYDNKNYAKTLFVVGFNHDNYERNKSNMKIINEYMEVAFNSISNNLDIFFL